MGAQTGWLYDRLVQVESRLRDAGLLWENMTIAEAAPKPAFFRSRQDVGAAYYGRIEGASLLLLFEDFLERLHRRSPAVSRQGRARRASHPSAVSVSLAHPRRASCTLAYGRR